MSTKSKSVVVEHDRVQGQYDMWCTLAIIEHHKYGRCLITEGFGGMYDLRGGMYRWEHGSLHRLQPGDTLASMRGTTATYVTDDNGNKIPYGTVMQTVLDGDDASRPMVDLGGSMIAQIAKSCGL